MSLKSDVVAGARDVSPFLLGIVPFGLVTGVSALEAGMSGLQAVGMSVIMFAGASQLALIDLVGRDTPVAVAVATAVVINLRYLMYSASIAPYFRAFSAPWKWVCSYFMTDQSFAVAVTEFQQTDPDERSRRWYYLGAATTLWVVWILTTMTGVVVGANVPGGLSLEFAVPLTFLALLVPAVNDRASTVVAVVAGGVAIPAAALPFDLGLMTAALLGLVVGIVVDARTDWSADESDGGAHR
ncbi:AzlC family ABC transporter permease [Haloarchaeobius sp. HRN-SO-5]|uniref:AzlC family ABC transporter permease n=1 Tax=Haloarchaeobius sp. HRN-SO-5 TaxID=3446118 RepID=UPI003EB75899